MDQPPLGTPWLETTTAPAAQIALRLGKGLEGRSNLNRYAILRPLAKGGLGQVWVAFDSELGREVALKEILASVAEQPDLQSRFLREAEVTGNLEHPGIVPIYGLGIGEGGNPRYAMRLVAGESLQAVLQRFHGADAQQSWSVRWREFRSLLGRFVAVCNAIAYAHSRGIIHRDLKPANVLLGPFGETLVIDWGLAGLSEGDLGDAKPSSAVAEQSAELTATSAVLGTPAYMSPEQAAGANTDSRTDVFGLGAVLYTLLTGRAPFGGEKLNEVLNQVLSGSFPAPRLINSRVPLPLEAICLKAMAVNPSERYPTATALAEEVEAWLADQPVAAYREPPLTRLTRWARRRVVPVTIVGMLLALLALTIPFGVANYRAIQLMVANAQTQATLSSLPSELNDAVERHPSSDTVYYERAIGKFALREFAAAVNDCAQAIDLNPQHARAHLLRSRAYQKLGMHDSAKIDQQEARRLDPQLKE